MESKITEGITWADEVKGCLAIRTDLEEFIPLNCGDSFELLIDDTWVPARIEKSDEWYFDVDRKPKNPDEMPLKGSLWDLSNYKVRISK